MRWILILLLIMIPGIMLAQETSYTYRKGEVPQITIKVNGTTDKKNLSEKRGNRIKIDGRWRYFKTDSIQISSVPCVNTSLQIAWGAVGKYGIASCPVVLNLNYQDSTSCVIFLNRSASLEQ